MPRYELVEGKSSKFWEISLEGSSFTTRWGRIGTEGQSTGKSFANPDAAKKEHDKLVAEKVKKGYKLVGDESPKPEKKKPAKKAASGSFRGDLYCYNETTAFVIASGAMAGKGFKGGDLKWKKAVEAGDIFPVSLVQDDSFIVRLVVGGELAPAEEDEWVGRLVWKLRVPDGKLMVAGGVEVIEEPLEEGAGRDYLAGLDALREVDVPAGDYRAELLAYLHGVNGHWLLDRADGSERPEKPGAYFRRTRPRAKFPAWLQRWCRSYPNYDPGHEKQWTEEVEEEEEETAWVDFLLRLTPLDAKEKLPKPALEDGFFSLDAFERRKPEKAPAGVAARDVIKNPPRPVEPRKIVPVDVLERVRDRALVPVAGGPVEHPVTALHHVYRIPWLATSSADPELRIEVPKKARFAPEWKIGGSGNTAATVISSEPGLVRIGIESSGARWNQWNAVSTIAERLGEVPDGCTVELLTAAAPDPQQHRDLGVARFRGEVRSGKWRIAETYPALDARTLREAIELSSGIESAKPIPLRDAAEGEKALALSRDDKVLFRKNPIVIREGSIGLDQPDEMGLMNWVAAYVLRVRWGHLFRPWVMPEEDRKRLEEEEAKIAKLRAKMAQDLEAKLAEANKAKPPRELVHEGKVGKYEKADMKAERPLEVESIESTDRQLVALGFTVLGDLVCSRFAGVTIRAYARGDTWAELLSTPLQNTFDYFTHWEKAGYTTSFSEGASKDDEAKGVYISRFPKLNFFKLDELHANHEKRKAALAKKLGAPLPAEATLRGFAVALDRGLARQMGLT